MTVLLQKTRSVARSFGPPVGWLAAIGRWLVAPQRLGAWCFLFYAAVLTVLFLCALASNPIGIDETLSYYQVSSRSFSQFLSSFEAGVNALPYVYFTVLWGIDQLVPLDPFTLRLPSLLFAIASVVLLHRLIRSAFGEAIAFAACVAALLLSELFTLHSHDARPYALYILAAVLCLYTCVDLVQTEGRSPRALAANAGLAFLLPAVHYVGLFYSAAAALSVSVALPRRSVPTYLGVGASFALGWLAFGLAHYSQIALFLSGQSAVDPTWIPRPGPSQIQALALQTAGPSLLPSPIPLMLLVFALVQLPAGQPLRLCPRSGKSPRVLLFLALMSILWIGMPLAFAGLGAIGLANVTLARYFAPSAIATATLAALALAVFYPHPDSRAANPPRAYVRYAIAGALLLPLVLSIQPLSVGIDRIVRAQHALAPGLEDPLYAYIAKQSLPCFTNSVQVFYQYSYYRGTGQSLSLLRRTAEEVRRLARLDRRISAATPEDLTGIERFLYIGRAGTVNSFPTFDLRTWARHNGYRVVAADTFGPAVTYEVYRVR